MKDNPVFILIVLFILVGLAWEPIKQGALLDKQANQGTSTQQTSSYSNNNQNYYPDSQTNYQNTPSQPEPKSEREISSDIERAKQNVKELERKLAEEEAKKKRSPYYGKVSFSYVANLNSSDPSSEYISLYLNLTDKEKINITGWKFVSEKSGNYVTIGKASVLPYPSSYKNYGDVIVHQGDTVHIIKGFSPIGISFRDNKCTGYLAKQRSFYPYLSQSCPAAQSEDLPKFSDNLDREDECVDLIKQVPACTDPSTYINFARLPDTVTESCKTYLREKLNYNTCVDTHFGDTDFPGHTWYVYLNIFGPLWRSRNEKIILYDNAGLIVSSIEY